MLPINTRSEEPERVFFLGQNRASVRQGKAQVFVLFRIILNLCGCGTGRSQPMISRFYLEGFRGPSLHAAIIPGTEHQSLSTRTREPRQTRFVGMSTTHSLHDESYVLIRVTEVIVSGKGGFNQRLCLSHTSIYRNSTIPVGAPFPGI